MCHITRSQSVKIISPPSKSSCRGLSETLTGFYTLPDPLPPSTPDKLPHSIHPDSSSKTGRGLSLSARYRHKDALCLLSYWFHLTILNCEAHISKYWCGATCVTSPSAGAETSWKLKTGLASRISRTKRTRDELLPSTRTQTNLRSTERAAINWI